MEKGEKATTCRHIGLDIHKYCSVVAGVDREGEEVTTTNKRKNRKPRGNMRINGTLEGASRWQSL